VTVALDAPQLTSSPLDPVSARAAAALQGRRRDAALRTCSEIVFSDGHPSAAQVSIMTAILGGGKR